MLGCYSGSCPCRLAGSGFCRLKPSQLAGLGAGLQQTASLTATGAKVGSAIMPGIGTAIGAVIGAVGSLFGPAKEGLAAQTWDDIIRKGSLASTPGRAFDERYFAEAFKGMLDKNHKTFPQCGRDAHKDPDCYAQPLAQKIIEGYSTKKVPLSATAQQVYDSVVKPWYMTGANGSVNWPSLASLPWQQKMIVATIDRYINGLPITRADMGVFTGAGYTRHVPPITQALAPLIAAAPAPVAAPAPSVPIVSTIAPAQVTPVSASTPAVAATPVAPTTPAVATTPPVVTPASAGVVAPGIDVNALAQALIAAGATPQQAYTGTVSQLQSAGVPITPDVQQAAAQASGVVQAGGAPAGMNTWLVAGALGIAALMFMTARPRRGYSHAR